MIITPNNTPVTIGPAWPCCYQYPAVNIGLLGTPSNNFYNGHNNGVTIAEIKRRFYNSIKSASVSVGSISYTVNFGNASLIADIAAIFNNLTINLFGNDWFYQDTTIGYPFEGRFFARNWKKVACSFNGSSTFATIVCQHSQCTNQSLDFWIFMPSSILPNSSGTPVAHFTIYKNNLARDINTFSIDGFSGDFTNLYWSAAIQFNHGGTNHDASITSVSNCSATMTAPTVNDFDFDFSSFDVSTSTDPNNPSVFIYGVPGQESEEISQRLQGFTATYNRQAPGIYCSDPIQTGISNFDLWPQTIYQRIIPLFTEGYFGGIEYYGGSYKWVQRPHLKPRPNLNPSGYLFGADLYGSPMHPDAPYDPIGTNPAFDDIYAKLNENEEVLVDATMTTNTKFIDLNFLDYEHRINQNRSGTARINHLEPPFQDW